MTKSASESAGELFPLPLTPWERYLIWDDRPECPMTSFIELHFTGPLQQSALSQALADAVDRHPMLGATLSDHGRPGDADRLTWLNNQDDRPRLMDPKQDPVLIDRPGHAELGPRPFDLRREPGCRFWYQAEHPSGSSRLLVQLHHACCDGVGLRGVLIDMLTGYAKHVGSDHGGESPDGKSRRQPRLNPELLRGRGDFSALRDKPVAEPLSGMQKLRNAYYFHVQRPRPLAKPSTNATSASSEAYRSCTKPPASDSTMPAASPTASPQANQEPLLHHIFDPVTSERIRELCRERSLAINDLALALLFQSCRDWNVRFAGDGDEARLRLLMPVDLRSREDLRMPATNRLSFSFLGRTQGQCEPWDDLLRSVQDETNWIKDSRVYLDFLDGLSLLHGRPRVMKWLLRHHHHMATSVLTYTGDIARGMKSHFPETDGKRRIGDSYLQNILIAPPARRGTNVSLGLCINWGQICISANWNREVFSRDDCRLFLTEYADAWRRWTTSQK